MQKRRMVLLVDDSATFGEIFRRGMVERGFAPTVASSGGEAMQALATSRYDLICSAMHLSDMQGTALCSVLRQDPRYAATPFFLFTADTDAEIQRRVLPEGVTEVFHKNEVGELFNYISHYPFDDQHLSGRILLIDDDNALRTLVGAILLDHGLQVTACADADSAWQQFAAGTFDLIVTDVVLSGQTSGLQFVRRVRRSSGSRGETPILAMTAFEDPARRIELFRAGINDYITKPLVEQEFVTRIDNLLLVRQALRAAIVRTIGDGLREIRRDLDAMAGSAIAPELQQRTASAARRLSELERTLSDFEPNGAT
jgi:CheY-like chemotaxis protein